MNALPDLIHEQRRPECRGASATACGLPFASTAPEYDTKTTGQIKVNLSTIDHVRSREWGHLR
jgi:hypothetical protein